MLFGRTKKAQEGGAVAPRDDAASHASTEQQGLKKNTFFERTGKMAAQRSSMNMDICIQGITLYAGDAGSAGGGIELIDRGTLALTYGLNYGMVGRNGVIT